LCIRVDDLKIPVDAGGRPQAGGLSARGERGERPVDGTGDSVERFRADHHADTLPDVSLDELAARGMRGIVVDLDNTVCAYRRPELAPGVADWVAAARDRGFALVLVSNNFTERVASVGAQLGIPVVPNALKPLPFAFLRALKLLGTPRRATVVIGDQLFTDVLGGKFLGLRTILTKPLVEKDFPLTRLLRFLERTVGGRT
jgi:HAD superfamily phosphatase (TIGR01668 family)